MNMIPPLSREEFSKNQAIWNCYFTKKSAFTQQSNHRVAYQASTVNRKALQTQNQLENW